MAYPIIFNGDHAEFEQEYANTPPKERPDWPLPSFDARDWAEAFCKIATNLGYKDDKGEPIDEGWMITWFANALMRGHDEASSKIVERLPTDLPADVIAAVVGGGITSDQVTKVWGLIRAALQLREWRGSAIT